MKDETRYALRRFGDALARLREGVSGAKDELDKDGVIQRFEFTFELLWKALKIVLEDEGVASRTPKECLRSAFKVGLIQDEEVFLDMLEDRNKTSHIYSKQESDRIFQRIRSDYLPLMEKVSRNLKKWPGDKGKA